MVSPSFSAGLALKATITQSPEHLVGKVGSEVIMNCEQRTTDHEWMYWYYHSRGQELRLVTRMLRGDKPNYENGYQTGYEMNRTEKDKHSTLRIMSLASKDQGLYFCASSDAR
ncbi:hypothetical protein GDO78_014535 [Eleutherodactylus coqui]|uniref:Ig-like domain-containing protein n=1 Tax=Eleutherodactylus coqui TaxID=57060 RepID=A0A8J6EMC0_ELECQ|nr:hypothetical protein GDO78_014535 [Eleutherodactylus coqui]